jgi:hypothetical protein
MKKLCATLLLLLVSCNQGPTPGKDGYTFGKKQYERQTVKVNIVTYKTEQEFSKVVAEKKLPGKTAAFTVLKYPFDTCTIHMIDPSVRYEPEYVGHEFLHCVYGQWHKNNNSF